MRAYGYIIILALCVFGLAAFIYYVPKIPTFAIQGKITPKGELVASNGETFAISNLGSLGKDWKDQEVEVTGYVTRQGQIPPTVGLGAAPVNRDTIEVVSYHVVGSSTWWDNCQVACEPRQMPS